MAHHHVMDGDGVPPIHPGVPYSPAVVAGDLCFLSGQVAFDPATGEFRAGTAAQEARIALGNLLATLRAAGFSERDLTYVNVVLADIDDWPAVNEVYASLLREPHPARMAYAGGRLPLDARVEIQAFASRAS